MLVDIIIKIEEKEYTVGQIDIDTLPARAMIEANKISGFEDALAFLKKYAHSSDEQIDLILDLPFKTVLAQLSDALLSFFTQLSREMSADK